MDLRDVMRTTGAARAFTGRAISDRELYGILDDARFAPSGSNAQPWRVIVVRDPDLRRQVKELFTLGWREYRAHIVRGFRPFAPMANGRWTEPAVDLVEARNTPAPFPFVDELDQHPVMLVVLAELAKLAVLDNGLDRQSIVGGASVYPFTHNILLAARDRGLGGVMTTQLCRQEAAASVLLSIPEGFAIAALVALGEPTSHPTRLSRHPVESFTTIDRFDGDPLGPPTPL
ncbi:MAG: nitroreductase family protein [Actinomycetes bacterium]|jgi:nitroreductase|uniref:Unannotated protein n=1 Tax=freshwater metagenome TaxID=449393 RepID=A0A6J6DVS6_9ZZZZ|nr:NADH dehydrogenase FAD-containing subunit [Actinomycetota bacterium]